MSQVQMPDLALNPEKSLSPNPLYADCAPPRCHIAYPEKKTTKGGEWELGGYMAPLPRAIYPPLIIKSHRQGAVRSPGAILTTRGGQYGTGCHIDYPGVGNLGTRVVNMAPFL